MQVHDRVRLIACPFGQGSSIMVYYLDAPRPALIDTGVAVSARTRIAPTLEEIGRRLEDVRFILCTHGHWDHMGGAAAARDASGGQVLIHRADEPYLRSHRHHLSGYFTARLRLLDPEASLAGMEAMLFENVGREMAADRALEDGDVVDLGGDVRLTVVHTPGHSSGSACFYWEAERLLFSGDAVQMYGSAGGRYPLYFEPTPYRQSIARLAELPNETLAMGHWIRGPYGKPGEAVRRGAEAQAALRASREASATIRAAVCEALAALWRAAPFHDVARRVAELVRGSFDLEPPNARGIVESVLPTTHAEWQEALGGQPR